MRKIKSSVIVPSKLEGKKRRLKQFKNVLIDPSLDSTAVYSQAYEQAVLDTQGLIERYAEIVLKDEIEGLKKQVYDDAYKNGYEEGCKIAQEKNGEEKESEIVTKKHRSKKRKTS